MNLTEEADKLQMIEDTIIFPDHTFTLPDFGYLLNGALRVVRVVVVA